MTQITSEYDHELKHFVDAMRYKLHVNRKKGKWEGAVLDDLFKALREEVEELAEAVEGGNRIATILEAADIANYALMIANVAMKLASTPPVPYAVPFKDEGKFLCQDSSVGSTSTSRSSRDGQLSGLNVSRTLPSTRST